MTNWRRLAFFLAGIALGVAVWLALLLPDQANGVPADRPAVTAP